MYVVLDKTPSKGRTRRLNLAAVRPATVQLNNRSFIVVAYDKAWPAAKACIDRKPLYTLYSAFPG
jgi:fructosamine-3-kinase